jgi:hypothetical protein
MRQSSYRGSSADIYDAALDSSLWSEVVGKAGGSTMENRLSSAVVGPAGGQLRVRSKIFS